MTLILEIETPNRMLRITEIKMFHAKAVALWRGKLTAAQEKFGNGQGGIAFIGSLGWVATASIVMGAIEEAMASKNSKMGMKILSEANALMSIMQERATFIPICQIAGIERAEPNLWQGSDSGVNFILLGDEFFTARTSDENEINIRWSAISTIRLLDS